MGDLRTFRFQYEEDVKLLGIPVTIEYVNSEGLIKRREVDALIDTGASQCCIDKKLAGELDFISMRKTNVGTAGGVVPSNVHTVNIVMPGDIRFDNEEIVESDAGISFVIGLNVLIKGDFMLSHLDGKTIFSFRMPPSNDGGTYRSEEPLKVSIGKQLF